MGCMVGLSDGGFVQSLKINSPPGFVAVFQDYDHTRAPGNECVIETSSMTQGNISHQVSGLSLGHILIGPAVTVTAVLYRQLGILYPPWP